MIWHSGSTCNVCQESDERNAALLWVHPVTGEHGVLASGVRNSFDGVWVPGIGYLFSDNGRDWDGDHPDEEVNLLVEGEAYGWPDDDPDKPVRSGTRGPIDQWTPHTSLNGLALRPNNSSVPGLLPSEGFPVYASVYGSWYTLLLKAMKLFGLISPRDNLTPLRPVNNGTVQLHGLQPILVRLYLWFLDLKAISTTRPLGAVGRCIVSQRIKPFTQSSNTFMDVFCRGSV